MIINIMLLEGADGKVADQIVSVLRLKPSFDDVETIRNEFSKVRNLEPLSQQIPLYSLSRKNWII